MGYESSDVVRFDFGLLLQGQTRKAKIKSNCNSLIIGPRICSVKPTYRKSWVRNLQPQSLLLLLLQVCNVRGYTTGL